jgi:hypothetical protein
MQPPNLQQDAIKACAKAGAALRGSNAQPFAYGRVTILAIASHAYWRCSWRIDLARLNALEAGAASHEWRLSS